MSPTAAPWQSELTRSFHDLLTSHLTLAAGLLVNQDSRSLQRPTDAPELKSLKKTLAALRLDFVTLFHSPANIAAHSASDRADVLQGKVTINGKKQQANAEFGASVVFLSDFLGINEARAAAIFQSACEVRARYQGWSKIKVAVHLFHRDREYLVESLILMVTRFVPGKVADDVAKLIASFLGELLALPVSFPQKILESMRYLRDTRNAFVRDTSLNGTITSEKVRQLEVESDVFVIHADHLARERNRLGDLLYFTSWRWRLTSSETMKLVGVLRAVEVVDVATVSMLCSLMINFDHLQVDNPRLELKQGDYERLQRELVLSPWQVPEMGHLAATQWTLFLNYCAHDAIDENVVDDEFRRLAAENYDDVSRKWRDHIGGRRGVYAFIGNYILPFRKTRHEKAQSPPTEEPIEIDLETRDAYTGQIERLSDGLIVFLRWALKDIKCRDEDNTRAADQLERKAAAQSMNAGHSMNSRSRTAEHSAAITIREQTAWESLLYLIMILYRDRPDAAISFWADQADMEQPDDGYQTPEKQAFMRMAADVRTSRFLRAFIHMLASLATGSYSAYQVHLKLNAEPRDSMLGSVLWTTFFTSLNSAIDILGREHRDLPPHEVDSIIAFLRLLRQVVKFSYSARRTLCDNQHLRAIHTLFWLLGSRVPVHLKAALLEAIAAFCIPLGTSYDIQLQVWAMLEQTQIVPTVKNTSGQTRMFSGSTSVNALRDGQEGILYDLEEIESKNGTYPETMAFLHLFDILLHGQNDVQMASVFQTLGMPERRPGIRPYVKLIIDHIFGKIFFRRCDDAEERAEMISTCLRIFDRCLDLFDLGTLMAEGTTDANGDEADSMSLGVSGFGPQILHNAQVLGLHPAFEVVCSLLGKSKLTARIFDTISIGVEAVNETANKESLCGMSVFLALRILLRVLQFQKAFLEILAPALLEVGAAEWIGLPSAMAGIDHLLSFRNTIVVNIAEYVMCVDDDIVLLVVKILATLSQSPVYGAVDPAVGMNRLLTLIQSAPSAERIVGGFVKRLEMEEDEAEFVPSKLEEAEGVEPGDVLTRAEADAAEELATLVAENWQSRTWPNPKAGVVHAVRIAILDLLITNVSDAPLPTIAHFLLGYDARPTPSRATETKYNCMHAVLALIRIPGEAGAGKTEYVASGCPIYRTHPRLAERCYRLVYQMCVDATLSASTMLHLRNQEDFFYEQIRAMPVGRAEEAEEADGAISGILARLLQRTWLMKAVALELHITIAARQTWHTQRLIDLLYVHIPTPAGVSSRGGYAAGVDGRMIDGDDWACSSQRTRGEQEFEVPLTKIMEILSTMNFDELHRGGHEKLAVALFPDVNFEEFRPQGGPLYDLAAIHQYLISDARSASKVNANRNGPDAPGERAADDVKRVLDALLATNQDREIGAARWQCAQAWAQIVQVTLNGGFTLLPGESREGIVFDILAALLHKMTTGRTSLPIAETMSLVVLEILDRMQKDRLYQSLLQTSTLQAEPSTIRLPTDTLLHAVLHGILRGILMAGATLEMRGNLYIALVRFLQYTKPDELEMQSPAPVTPAAPGSPVNAETPPTTTPVKQQPSIISSRARLLQNIYMFVSNDGEKLLETICRDAADGSGVWNIVAFVALNAISELAAYNAGAAGSARTSVTSGGKITSWVLDVIVQRNFLSQFVRALSREDDLALRGIDPRSAAGRFLAGESTMTDSPGDFDDNGDDGRGTLNAHLLFEMKMAFLLRLSFQREGAHKLLGYGIVEALSECKFVDQRPEADGSYNGGDIDAEERYHNALVPTLQLVLSVARQTQRENSTPSRVAAFVGAHQHVLVAILRDVPRIVTLATLKQVELATALFAYLAADGADGAAASIVRDGLPAAGHATFHDLLLSLLNRHLAPTPTWTTRLTPSSKAEEEMDRVKVVFLGRASTTTSKFRHEADRITMDIVRNLLSYAVAVSEGATLARDERHSRSQRPSAMPLFRFIFVEEKDSGASLARSMRASVNVNAPSGVTLNAATTPSLAAICHFTSRTIDTLAQAVEDHRNVNLKIADLHRLSMDEIQNIIANVKHLVNIDGGESDEQQSADSGLGDAGDLGSSRGSNALPPAQKRQLALVALQQHRADMVRLVAALLYLVEHLLLLLWRHLVFMQSNSAASAVPVPFVGSGEKRAGAIASAVSPLLNKLQGVEFEEAAGGAAVDGAGDARKMFLMMLTRQLGEIVQAL
ncbi:hypothetical protein HDU86_007199 [Geranomyces michiganensis]|nr:hypothetical protein HDU86_007199 [Geranomyces michiganensis]